MALSVFNFREHGQYHVVLVEDARKKYMDCLGLAHSCNLMDTGTGSNQIYMTFPVHSKFTDDDVENYFKYCLNFIVTRCELSICHVIMLL